MRRRSRPAPVATVEWLESRQLLVKNATIGAFAVDYLDNPASDIYRTPTPDAPSGVHFHFKITGEYDALNLTYTITASPNNSGLFSLKDASNNPIAYPGPYHALQDIYVVPQGTTPPIPDVTLTLAITDANGDNCCGLVTNWTTSPSTATITIHGDSASPTTPPPSPLNPTDTPTDRGAPICPTAQKPQPTENASAPGISVTPTVGTKGKTDGFDGSVTSDPVTLFSDGFGKGWGLASDWSSVSAYSQGSTLGKGFVNIFQPAIRATALGQYFVVSSATAVRYYDSKGFAQTIYRPEILRNTTTNDTVQFEQVDEYGNTIRFYDFSPGLPAAQQGKFKEYEDAYGNKVTTVYDTSSGMLTKEIRNDGVTTETFAFTYIATGPNAGLMSDAELRRSVSGGAEVVVRKAHFDYYDGSQPYGRAGDLKYEKVLDPSGAVIDTTYYRYYTSDSGTGYADGMQYIFHPDAYARLFAAVGDPSNLSDQQVAPFADNYYQYDIYHRVTMAVDQGAGCSCSDSTGAGGFTYSYMTSPSTVADDINNWRSRTIETLPDGNQEYYYYNYAGELILDATIEAGSGRAWATSYRYDAKGRLIQTAQPSAVAITSLSTLTAAESNPDLVGYAAGAYQYLLPNSGLIQVAVYAQSTSSTINSTTAGDAEGYLTADRIKQGYNGAAITTDSYRYYAHVDAKGATTYPIASVTLYPNQDNTGARTTNYSYGWFLDGAQDATSRIQAVIAQQPPISAGQDGPGTPDTTTTVYDTYGRPTWARDGDNFIHYTAYDNATGAVVKTIVDVDTTQTSNFANLPIGWATRRDGGLNLTTTDQVDGLGRAIREVDAKGAITYWVYRDALHETRTYRGWDPVTGTTTGPTEVARQDQGYGYVDTLTMAAPIDKAGTSGTYTPIGTEAIGSILTLTRDQFDLGGRLVEADSYHSLPGSGYPGTLVPVPDNPYSRRTWGTPGANYYATTFGYDARGRLSRVVDAVGTITGTAYDVLGRAISVSVGTADGYGGTPASNMTQVAGYAYDGGGVGDGDLTSSTAYPGGGDAPRVTRYAYDWRDRLVAMKGGDQSSETDPIHRQIVYLDYDNLGEILGVSRFDGDGVAPSASKPSPSLLRAFAATVYDAQGRAFIQGVYPVDQATGAIPTSYSLATSIYYDHRGNAIAAYAPGGLVTKDRLDGAGRVVDEALTDGAAGGSWSAAGSLAADHVLAETRTDYDGAGDPIRVTTLDRFHDTAATGDLIGPGAAASAPAVGDAGFEAAPVGSGYAYAPAASAWTFSGYAGVAGNGSAFTYNNPAAPSGSQVAFLQQTGALVSQSLPAWAAGSYIIAFQAAQWGSTPSNQDIQVRVDGVVVGTFTPASTSYQAFATTPFAVAAGSHTVTFQGLNTAGGNNTALIDSISIAAINAAAPAVGDAGFEAAPVGSGYAYAPAASAWTFSGYAGVAGNGSAFTYNNPAAPSGSQVAFLQQTGALVSQSLPAWAAGSYIIAFQAAQWGSTPSNQDIQVRVDGVVVGTFTPASTSYQAFATTPFAVAAGSHTVTFQGLNTAGGNNTALIDSISIAAINAAAPANARASYAAYYYDAAGRLVDAVDVGTNGGAAYARPASAPARSDTALVTTYHYDDAGWVDRVTDPRGIQSRTTHDALGRAVEVVAAYVDGVVAANEDGTDNTTRYAYDGLGHVTAVTAVLSTATAANKFQVTTYAYGVTTTAGSAVNSNDLLGAVVQPDEATGLYPTSNLAAHGVAYAYNALGQVVGMTDANGTTHAYAYDVLGRQTSDAVTTLGTGVDGAVRRLETAYDTAGRAYLFTSYDAASGGGVVNQVLDKFNGLGQLTAEYQEHSGAVNTSSSAKVQYSYTEMAGGQDNSRLVSMAYPNGRVVDYTYDAGIDSAISRPSAIADDASGSPGTVLESYKYLGLGTVVERAQPQAGVKLTYVRQPGDASANGDGGDRYTGLDRFGRVIDQNWVRTSAGGGVGGGAAGTSTVRLQYTYDRLGNATSRHDLVNAALDELYSYDYLDRLTSMKRGTLSASAAGGPLDTIAAPSHQQSWALDALGNWSAVTTDGSTTTRQFDAANQATSASGQAAPTYSPGGNATSKDGSSYTYDAWDRLASAGGATPVAYAYDALGRRVVEGSGPTATQVYFSPDWQAIEERTGASAATAVVANQYVLGLTGQVLLRDTYASGSIDATKRRYAQQDANGDTMALVYQAAIQERYRYDAYGSATIMDPSGATVAAAGSLKFRALFQGGRYDYATGLYNFRHRDLDPNDGAWMERDPLGLAAGDMNTRRFVGNNPVNLADPTGYNPLLITGAIGAGGGFVVGAGLAWYNNPDASWGEIGGAGASGALVGGVAGLTGGFVGGVVGGGVVGAGGSGFAGAVIGGYAGGVAGDMAGQATNMLIDQALGNPVSPYDPYQSLEMGFIGGVLTGAGYAAVRQPVPRGPRARHHTSPEYLKSIKRESCLNPSRGEDFYGVDFELEPFGRYRPGLGGPKDRLGAANEGAYVEVDVPANMKPTSNVSSYPDTNTGRMFTGTPLPLSPLNPSYGPPWWMFWKGW